jgi:hypothetical protein
VREGERNPSVSNRRKSDQNRDGGMWCSLVTNDEDLTYQAPGDRGQSGEEEFEREVEERGEDRRR